MGVSLRDFSQMEESEKMHGIRTFHIQVQGQVDECTFNATSPFRVSVVQTDADVTLFAVHTDQSGLIGLMRHLHGHGFAILSVCRERQSIVFEEEK
jgi:hypothetical protein